METRPGEIKNVPQEREPKLVFTIGGEEVNLKDVLSTPEADRKYIARRWTYDARLSNGKDGPEAEGDRAAQALLGLIGGSGVTFEQYMLTMPRLFEYAEKKEGGFDKARIGYMHTVFDRTAKRMNLSPFVWARGMTKKETMDVFLARSYGYIEALDDFIYDPLVPGKTIEQRGKEIENTGLKNPHVQPSKSST